MQATIDRLIVGDEPESWANAGFTVDDDGICRIGTVRVELAGRAAGKGLRRWSLRDTEPLDDIDGIPTATSDEPPATGATHPNGSLRIDHLVLMSADGERTARAITAATGLDVRRTRETGTYGAPMLQRFFRMGEVVLELISAAEPSEGPARFFGIAVDVEDLDGLHDLYGDRLGAVKEAVQPGRRIATLRHKDLDLSVAIAFMSPGAASA
ncbi:MAG: glyoxalase [Acidimicrobiia bacterium]|nr:glyoxalase [Acidimicrobiia bacterium]